MDDLKKEVPIVSKTFFCLRSLVQLTIGIKDEVSPFNHVSQRLIIHKNVSIYFKKILLIHIFFLDVRKKKSSILLHDS